MTTQTPVRTTRTLLCGFHHVAVLTPDLDRLVEFYRVTFDAAVAPGSSSAEVRNAFIEIGGGAALHAFEVTDVPAPSTPRYQRGRLDHLALHAPTREAFLDVRGRLMATGNSDGGVRDFRALWSLPFRDPDGLECEVIWAADPDADFTAPPRLLADADLDIT